MRRSPAARRSAPATAALGPREQVVDAAERVADPVLAAVAHQQHAPVAERPAAMRAATQAVAGIAWREDPPRLPVRPLDRPRHDVLEPAERSRALALRLRGPKPLVARDIRSAPAALGAIHGIGKP